MLGAATRSGRSAWKAWDRMSEMVRVRCWGWELSLCDLEILGCQGGREELGRLGGQGSECLRVPTWNRHSGLSTHSLGLALYISLGVRLERRNGIGNCAITRYRTNRCCYKVVGRCYASESVMLVRLSLPCAFQHCLKLSICPMLVSLPCSLGVGGWGFDKPRPCTPSSPSFRSSSRSSLHFRLPWRPSVVGPQY
jgi:hypothetical protein